MYLQVGTSLLRHSMTWQYEFKCFLHVCMDTEQLTLMIKCITIDTVNRSLLVQLHDKERYFIIKSL